MKRTMPSYVPERHGKMLMAGEPLVFHCNYYNYFLQKTLLLDEELGMDQVIHDAALSCAHALLSKGAVELGLRTKDERRALAEHTFSQLGFGVMDLSETGIHGGVAVTPCSHYGQMLRAASGADFRVPQTIFDAGYAAAATAFIHGCPVDSFAGAIEACQSMGAPAGRHRIGPRTSGTLYASTGAGGHRETMPVAACTDTNVDEGAILKALATLDFSGNEEGLVPRFGVMLTHHFASFYNRISYEFVRQMARTGLLEAAEDLLVEAGLRCAFHTFGGIMSSPEWDAVIAPQCKTRADWVHGMVAVVNSLGWGVWRVTELTDRRLVVRIYDDYESSGHEGMYGKAERPVSYLHLGAVAGLMNLVYAGDIASRPSLDYDYYARVFDSSERFMPRAETSMAMGHDYTEIVGER